MDSGSGPEVGYILASRKAEKHPKYTKERRSEEAVIPIQLLAKVLILYSFILTSDFCGALMYCDMDTVQ